MYKYGSPDDKCIDSHPHRLQGQKVKSHGVGAYCGGHLAAQLVVTVFFRCMPSVIESGLHVSQTGDITLLSSEQHTDT